MDGLLDIKEDDVPYHIRVCIDKEIRCSFWYKLKIEGKKLLDIEQIKTKLDKADLRILAFDIETTKAPLMFPDSSQDMIFLISYVIDGHGYLIVNRTVISADIHEFDFTPKKEYETHFIVFNEVNEQACLIKFFQHVREAKPFIFTTFNGDNFDWEFIADRAKIYGLSLINEIGIYKQNQIGYSGRFAVHMDCFCWVDRDAYLPQGSHGLKAVTRAKLGYEPEEIEPEQMLECAAHSPQKMASYSASDAVATYFLYKKMIHDFIFALCTIIPTDPDEVLRKGSGTLCENVCILL